MKTNEGWDDMLKAAKAKSGPQPNGGSGVKQGTRYGGSKSKMDAPAPTKGPSVSQLRSLKKDMKKEDVNQVDEDMKSAAAELSKYAKGHGGIDKADFQKAAKHMEAGDHKSLHKHISKLDTDPRDKILTTLHKHGNDIKRYGYTTEEVEQIDESDSQQKYKTAANQAKKAGDNIGYHANMHDYYQSHADARTSGGAGNTIKNMQKAKFHKQQLFYHRTKAKNATNEEMAIEMDEALVGNQHKLDKNKNGRLDKHDFKKLRGEEKDTITMNPKMKSTKSSGETNNESVKSADKEAETYIDSKGKTKYRMVAKDKNMKVESKIRTSLKSVLENKQTAGAAVQPMNDSNTISGAGAKKMKKDHEPVIPKGGDEPAQEKDNFDNATAGVNKSPMRPNDNAKGDKNIINPVSDITKKASKKEDDGFKQGGAPKLATSEGFIDKISQIYKNMFK